MRKISLVAFLVGLVFSGCSIFSETIMMEQVIAEKQKIDTAENPAKRRLLNLDLRDKRISIKNILVKDVTISTNIDYDFCVIADAVVSGKKIECFIYSKNIKRMSKLIKGKSRINVVGDFSRFFTILDDYYTKIDIVDARITLIEPEAETEEKKEELKKEPEKPVK